MKNFAKLLSVVALTLSLQVIAMNNENAKVPCCSGEHSLAQGSSSNGKNDAIKEKLEGTLKKKASLTARGCSFLTTTKKATEGSTSYLNFCTLAWTAAAVYGLFDIWTMYTKGPKNSYTLRSAKKLWTVIKSKPVYALAAGCIGGLYWKTRELEKEVNLLKQYSVTPNDIRNVSVLNSDKQPVNLHLDWSDHVLEVRFGEQSINDTVSDNQSQEEEKKAVD